METTYEEFVATEGVPVLKSFAISDLGTVPVQPWDRMGANGTYIHLDGRGLADGYVCEIGPGRETKWQHHLFEESVYAVKGSGRTELWNDSGFTAEFNWEAGAVFAIPLNAHYRHINLSDTEPLRVFAVTSAPLMMNVFHDTNFIFNCDKDFLDRFSPEVTDFTRPAGANVPVAGREARFGAFSGNLVPSAFDVPLPPAPARGANGGLLSLELANSALGSHISEFPSRTYKKAHRHGAGAHVILLTGTGYSLLWKGDEEPVRVDWQPGAVVVPPEKWFHQHFNTGDGPARYLALRFGGGRHGLIPEYSDPRPTTQGGDQIEYEDEDPRIKAMFEAEIGKANGR